jgi:hypothetical protein
VGRIVHYLPPGASDDSACMAAVVTFVGWQGDPALTVFWPPLVAHQAPSALASVPERKAGQPVGGTWHWPERQPE